ncbi:MAG: hypothetical protein ACI4M5_06150 [Christensenellales bacterium]
MSKVSIEKLAKAKEIIKKVMPIVSLLLLVLVSTIRYVVCRSFECAISYGLAALLICSIITALVDAVLTVVIKLRIKKMKDELKDVDINDELQSSDK